MSDKFSNSARNSDHNRYDNIVYRSNMLRPVMKRTELEVHKIANQVWNQNISPELIVNDYYLKSGVTEIADYETAEKMIDDMPIDELPVTITEDDIQEVLEYADENRSLIEDIIEEDEKLKSIIFNENGGVRESKLIKEKLENTNFNYYNIEFHSNVDGFSISWRQNSTD